MKFACIFCVLILFTTIGGYKLTEICGKIDKKNYKSYRIVGGTPAIYMEFPWLSLIQDKEEGEWIIVCGSSIISSKFILTAAHCFLADEGPKKIKKSTKEVYKTFRVLIGIGNWTDSNEKYREEHHIADTYVHNKFDMKSKFKNDDIALVKLKRRINFEGVIRPICLPNKNHTVPGSLIVAGWGDMKYEGLPSSVLLKTVVTIVPNTDCKFKHRPLTLADKQMCTTNTNTSACQGDSGGPAMCYIKGLMFICGVISFGNFCGGVQIYTNVIKYRKWIKKAKRKLIAKNRQGICVKKN